MSKKNDNTRIYVQGKISKIYKFINIISVYKKNRFFAYKFILKGFPESGFRFLKKAVVDTREGIIKKGELSKLFKGKVEVTYHADGKTTFKDLGEDPRYANIRPMVKFPSIKKIAKSCLLFRLMGIKVNALELAYGGDKKKECYVINFNDSSFLDDYMTCDFYISNKKTLGNHRFAQIKWQESFSFENDREDFCVELHFYPTKINSLSLMISKNSLFHRANRELLYLFYILKNKFSSFTH